MTRKVRRRLALVGMLTCLAAIGLIAPAGTPGHAQQFSEPQPASGPPGTMVTISGNLIGCYGSGPGIESSTWGFPKTIAYYWNDLVLDDAHHTELQNQVGQNPDYATTVGRPLKTWDVSQGAGWRLEFSVPNEAVPGPHYNYLVFKPMCNYKSVDHPDGYTDAPAAYEMSFCVTDKNLVCPPAAIGGDSLGGGYHGGPKPTGGTGLESMDREIKWLTIKGEFAVFVAGVGILILGMTGALGVIAAGTVEIVQAGIAALRAWLSRGAPGGGGAAGPGGMTVKEIVERYLLKLGKP